MQTFHRGALTFDVRDAGPVGGDVVVLLHGFPQHSSSWDLVTPLLHERGLRTLCPDQRGYSPGARPAGRRAYALDELVDDVLALVEASGAPAVHLVGHDWGAAVAWGVAAAHPDRVRTLSALSVPHPRAFLRAMSRSPQLLRSWYMVAFQLPGLPERAMHGARLVRQLVSTGLPAAAAERDAAFLASPGALTAAINWYRAIPFGNPRAESLVRVPTLYVWGDGDRFLTRAAAEACGRYVEAPYRFEVLRGADHWTPEKNAGEVGALLAEHLT